MIPGPNKAYRDRYAIVGAGSGPCVVAAVGSREHSEEPGGLALPAAPVARAHGAGGGPGPPHHGAAATRKRRLS